MSYTINVSVEGDYPVDEDALRLAAHYALEAGGAEPPVAISVIVTSDEHVHQLNWDFAGIDSPTDVLSFSPEDDPYNVEPGEPPYFGDVIIAYPIAEQQAKEAGHPTLNELQLLAIHGALHLLGYNHDTDENKATMWALQSAAMDAVRAAGSSSDE